jgi:hypothetical protein
VLRRRMQLSQLGCSRSYLSWMDRCKLKFAFWLATMQVAAAGLARDRGPPSMHAGFMSQQRPAGSASRAGGQQGLL